VTEPDLPWTPLLPLADVPPGGVASVEVGELDLVVWCRLDGSPVVMEARCPHQWSHLGAEGVVDGDEIVCAAHFWRFDGDGCGTKLNVLGRRDPKADIATFPARLAPDGAGAAGGTGGLVEALLPARDPV